MQGQKVVLIENEFGEIGIDGGFLKESGIQINEMNAGCICCSLVGDFRAALQQVVEQYHPDRIVIEPSGVGKLSDVTRAVEGVAEHLDVQLSSFVTVADVNKVKMYMKNFGEFYDDQIEPRKLHHPQPHRRPPLRRRSPPLWPCCARRTPPPPSSPPHGTL